MYYLMILFSVLLSLSYFWVSSLGKIFSLFSLLLNLINLSLTLYFYLNSPFESVILVIMFMTGLFILMSYVVSTFPENPDNVNLFLKMKNVFFSYKKFFVLLLFSVLIYSTFFFYYYSSSVMISFFNNSNLLFSSNPFISVPSLMVLILIFLILWIVWLYLRLTYSKGSGLCMKFKKKVK